MFPPELWVWHSPSHQERATHDRSSLAQFPLPQKFKVAVCSRFSQPTTGGESAGKSITHTRHPQMTFLTVRRVDLASSVPADICRGRDVNRHYPSGVTLFFPSLSLSTSLSLFLSLFLSLSSPLLSLSPLSPLSMSVLSLHSIVCAAAVQFVPFGPPGQKGRDTGLLKNVPLISIYLSSLLYRIAYKSWIGGFCEIFTK